MYTADWIVHALCRTEGNPEHFFPADTAGSRESSARAKLICRRCPVQTECLDEALARNEAWGVWGGVHLGQTRAAAREEMRRIRGIGRKATR